MANYGDLLFIEHVERLPMSDCESMPAEVRDRLRSIPAVHELLAEWPVMKAAGDAGDTMVREAVAAELDAERAAIRSGAPARNKRSLDLGILTAHGATAQQIIGYCAHTRGHPPIR